MMKIHCDICDNAIPKYGIYYRCQKIQLQHFSVNETVDVCKDCFNAIERFKQEELKHE